MVERPLPLPLLVLLRGGGELVYAQGGCEGARDLPGILAACFPKPRDRERATRILGRATAAAARCGRAGFRATLRGDGDGPAWADVQVERWSEGAGEMGFLVSVLPGGARDGARGSDPSMLALHAMVRRVRRILDGASASARALRDRSEEGDPTAALLVAQVGRARGLLASLEGQAEAWLGSRGAGDPHA